MSAVIRATYLPAPAETLEAHIEAAYLLGLGVRLSNEADVRGGRGWVLELRADEEFVSAGAEVRTWPLPDGAPLLRTWTSEDGGRGGAGPTVVAEAVRLAVQGDEDGRWVRVHTLLHGDGPREAESGGTSVLVVDVFDAPVPVDPEA